MPRTMSAPRLEDLPLGFKVMLLAVFTLFGVVGFWGTATSILGPVSARSWRQTSCVILGSGVAESSGGRSSTYKVGILYTYSMDGRSYQSRQYQFGNSYSGDRQGKEKIVASLPPGTRTTCWVDPADPSEAVISRSFSPASFFNSFFSLALGAWGFAWVLQSIREERLSGRTGD